MALVATFAARLEDVNETIMMLMAEVFVEESEG